MFWYSDAGQKDKLWFELSTDVIALKGYSKTSQLGTFTHPSTEYKNTGCISICVHCPLLF